MKYIEIKGPFLKVGIELDVLNSWRVIHVELLPVAPDFSTWCSISGEWRR